MTGCIDSAMERWFGETEEAFKKVHTDSSIDFLCVSVTALAHNYCSATLFLLNKGHRLPAMALLRVLAELAFRLIWCLYRDNPQKESCDVRIERWIKTSLLERKKYVQRMLKSTACSEKETEGFKKELEKLEQMISQIKHKEMGDLYSALDGLPELYRRDLYPRLYSICNWGVHPNLWLLEHLVKQNAKFNTVVSDIDEDPVVLKIYCLTMAFNIIAVVRLNYEWDYDTIKTEYLKIKKDFSKEQKA